MIHLHLIGFHHRPFLPHSMFLQMVTTRPCVRTRRWWWRRWRWRQRWRRRWRWHLNKDLCMRHNAVRPACQYGIFIIENPPFNAFANGDYQGMCANTTTTTTTTTKTFNKDLRMRQSLLVRSSYFKMVSTSQGDGDLMPWTSWNASWTLLVISHHGILHKRMIWHGCIHKALNWCVRHSGIWRIIVCIGQWCKNSAIMCPFCQIAGGKSVSQKIETDSNRSKW